MNIIIHFQTQWWWMLWIFFFLFTMFMMVISPYVIEPLFNRFKPLEDDLLTKKIQDLFTHINIRIKNVYEVDASKRSRHSNAYFTGIGKNKRIVIYDTLLNKLSHRQIIAVLSHEAGHWKKKHLMKSLIVMELISLLTLYAVFKLFQSHYLIDVFNIDSNLFTAELFLIVFLIQMVLFFLQPLQNILSRKNEREADEFSYQLIGTAKPLMESIKILVRDNLSVIFVHPVYSWFYYSHPPIIERLFFLKKLEERNKP